MLVVTMNMCDGDLDWWVARLSIRHIALLRLITLCNTFILKIHIIPGLK